MNRKPLAVWVGIAAAVGVYDLHCDRNATVGDTFSEVTRATFRTHTPHGRAAFLGVLGAAAVGFARHILATKETHQ